MTKALRAEPQVLRKWFAGVLSAGLMAGCTPTAEPHEIIDVPDAESVARCMGERGWDVSLDSAEGSMELLGVPDDQMTLFDDDLNDCAENASMAELVVDREHAEDFFDKLVATGVCLEAAGFAAPEPPSREASVESMLNGNGMIDPLWDPFEIVFANGTRADLEAAYESCPYPEWGA